MYVIYVNDTETTGTDPVKNDIIELSMSRVLFDKNKVSTEQKTWYIAPINPQNIEDAALKVNGYKKEDLLHKTEHGKLTFRPANLVLPEVEQWMDEDNSSVYDRLFIGHNPQFDLNFMYEMWRKLNCQSTFPFEVTTSNGAINFNRVLDTKEIVTFIDLCTGKRRKYYNLSSCVKAFDVKAGKAHKAEEDVRMTVDLLLKLLMPVRGHICKIFENCYEEK